MPLALEGTVKDKRTKRTCYICGTAIAYGQLYLCVLDALYGYKNLCSEQCKHLLEIRTDKVIEVV